MFPWRIDPVMALLPNSPLLWVGFVGFYMWATLKCSTFSPGYSLRVAMFVFRSYIQVLVQLVPNSSDQGGLSDRRGW